MKQFWYTTQKYIFMDYKLKRGSIITGYFLDWNNICKIFKCVSKYNFDHAFIQSTLYTGAQHKVNFEAIMLVTLLDESETQTGNH